MDAIVLRDITKTFGKTVAVADLSLAVPRGSVYGFIGPNGSGKTTTLRMIVNILYPDRGEIAIFGEPLHGACTDRLGYMPEERGLYKRMKVRELLRFYGELKSGRNVGKEVDLWLNRLDLNGWANKKVETLSKGMSQKVQFIATVVSQPEIVILDEPFAGLDPVNAEVIKDAVLELQARGTTDKKVAVVDRSGVVAEALVGAAELRNRDEIHDQETGRKIKPAYFVEIVTPDEADPQAQRLQLSDRVRRGELHAFLEIGPEVVHPGENKEASRLAYHARNAAMDDLRHLVHHPLRLGRRTHLPRGPAHARNAAQAGQYHPLGPAGLTPAARTANWGALAASRGKRLRKNRGASSPDGRIAFLDKRFGRCYLLGVVVRRRNRLP